MTRSLKIRQPKPDERRRLQLPLPQPAAFLTRERAQDDTFSGTAG